MSDFDSFDYLSDPGPCPCDGTPHHGCTTPGFQGSDPAGNVIMIGPSPLAQLEQSLRLGKPEEATHG